MIDVGGGSTELVVGEEGNPRLLSSLQIGCVSYLQFFPEGVMSADRFQRAYQSACSELESVSATYQGQWQQCIGSSGTLLAVEQVLIQQGLVERGISRTALKDLQHQLLSFQHLDEIRFHGLRESRREVFASGLAITLALFDRLDIEQMILSDAALREGVLIDMLSN